MFACDRPIWHRKLLKVSERTVDVMRVTLYIPHTIQTQYTWRILDWSASTRGSLLLLWPPCVADADIIFLSCVSFFFFPRLISAAADWMSTVLIHMVWSYCEFRMQAWMCCMRLAGNAGPKKSTKIRHMGTIAQLCRAISSQLRHVSTIGKKTC